MDAVLEWVKTFLSFLGPILVVVVTARVEKNRKADAKVKQLEDEKRAREAKDLQDSLQGLRDDIQKINKRIDGIDDTISQMQKFDQSTKDNMESIAKTYQLTSTYIHELAQLVTVLAEGMRDQHLDGNVTQAIDAYRTFEHNTLTSLMTTSLDK